MTDFLDDDPMAGKPINSQTNTYNSQRKRTKVIALVALGSITALGIYACNVQMNEDQEQWSGSDGSEVANNGGNSSASGTTQSRSPSIWPWFWLMSRNNGVRTAPGARAGGSSSFFGTGSTSSSSRSSGTSSSSRGGFGSFGRAFSGLS